MTPDPDQQRVIDAGPGYWLVQAGPGAGKSETVLNRFVRLVESGEDPADILALSFTSAAAKNLRDRAAKRLVRKMDTDRLAGWMTLHSFALQFAIREREQFPFPLEEHPLMPEAQSIKICWEAGKRFDCDPRRLKNYIGLQKRRGVRPIQAIREAEKEHKDEKLALAYKAYQNKMYEAKLLDFDSLLMEMLAVFRAKPEVLERHSPVWLSVDEAQDCSAQDWEIIRALSQKHGNMLAVGDGGQAVFGFRGSDTSIFRNLETMFPTVQKLYLGRNYRSTPEVVGLLRKAGPIPELAEKFYTTNPSGPEPVVVGYAGPADEAQAVVRYAQEHGTDGVAVLARTNRALRPIEDAFSMAGIKYRLLSKSGFWAQSEIRSSVAYLNCAIYESDWAVPAALRAPFWPAKYIRKDLLAKIKERPEGEPVVKFLREKTDDAVGRFVHFLDSLRKYRDLPARAAVEGVLRDLKAIEHYQDEGAPDNDPVDNLKELLRMSGKFSSLKEFLDWTRRVANSSKSKKAVSLGTIHSAKGLQWRTVFLIQCSEGVLPHSRAEDLESEKNCLFVAISRPERELYISYTGQPSRFLLPFLKKEDPPNAQVANVI